MLLSMTGFGEAHCHENGLAVAVEVRTDQQPLLQALPPHKRGLRALEPQIEEDGSAGIRRGTVQVNLRVDRFRSPETSRSTPAVLDRYRLSSRRVPPVGDEPRCAARGPVVLPGVVDDQTGSL